MCSPRFTLESLGDLKNTDVWVPLLETLVTQIVKGLPARWETWVGSLSWEDPLEEGMATHSRILAWKVPWTEEPGELQSMGLQMTEQLSTHS